MLVRRNERPFRESRGYGGAHVSLYLLPTRARLKRSGQLAKVAYLLPTSHGYIIGSSLARVDRIELRTSFSCKYELLAIRVTNAMT